MSGNCHKHFRTEDQARAFIQEWTDLYLEILLDLSASKLAQGWRPTPASLLLVRADLMAPSGSTDIEDLVEHMADTNLGRE